MATVREGPRGPALLGNLGELNRDQLGFYTRCAREYGDLVPVRLGPRRGLLIYHPDTIEEVLVTRNRDFIKSRGVRLLRALLGDGLVLSEGDLCIGNAFAMMEAILILAATAQRFRLILTPGQQVVPTPYITLRPEPGIRVRLERR